MQRPEAALLPLLFTLFCGTSALAQTTPSAPDAGSPAAAPPSQSASAPPPEDPHLWLEDINGTRAMAWVKERNAEAAQEFSADPGYEALRTSLLEVLNSRERIPSVQRMEQHYYNFWRDENNPRGIWRRTPLSQYRQPNPAWETVLDLDDLARRENENWVWKGSVCLRPDRPFQPYRRCLLQLSRGGADAVVVREFDLAEKLFVGTGFNLAEAKQDVDWKDIDTVWVASDFGPGSTTRSGYPRTVREWTRGRPLAAAAIVFEGQESDVGVEAYSERDSGKRRDWVRRSIAFWNTEHHLLRDGKLVRIDVPRDADIRTFKNWLVLRTRSPWTLGTTTHAAGSLLAIDFDRFMRGAREFDVLYAPGPRTTLSAIQQTQNALLLTELGNVRTRLWEVHHDGRTWRRRGVEAPDNAQISVASTYWGSDRYFYTLQDFATPTTLMVRNVGTSRSESLKALPRYFDANGLSTRQFEATSRDGTRIPYFVAMRDANAGDGPRPALLYGYGGFAHSQLPWYSGVFGRGWLARGGALVVANLRGGGEFGPAWHQAAQKENKQRTWDDMIAVAEDLVRRGITSPKHLGIMGGSQGGLLVTTVMAQRPELFGAVVSQVPLTDMLRFHKLLAGASWIAEYGDPDNPEDRAYISRYSPYQNVSEKARYPRLFLVTSTRDDRVHPGHARKLAARMAEQGHDVLYFENTEGGHGAAANNEQAARMWAQCFSFLWRTLAPMTEKAAAGQSSR
jgi:prolyl oligopeptidase